MTSTAQGIALIAGPVSRVLLEESGDIELRVAQSAL
jgi:hypothetical protein